MDLFLWVPDVGRAASLSRSLVCCPLSNQMEKRERERGRERGGGRERWREREGEGERERER